MSEHYIEPQKDKNIYTCPHCNTISQMEVNTHHFQGDLYTSHGCLGIRNQLTIHRCQCCGKKIIWVDNDYIYPDIIKFESNSYMPENIKQLYDEAGLICNNSPRAACALLRLAIDRLCLELGENDRDINKNIGALVRKGLPQSIQQALDIVRVVGNKAVHPGQISIDVENKETAFALMKLVNIIVEKMIAEPKEINSLYEQLPESVKTSISDRDE